MTALPRLKARVKINFPPIVEGTNGIVVTKSNGEYTIGLDVGILTTDGEQSITNKTELAVGTTEPLSIVHIREKGLGLDDTMFAAGAHGYLTVEDEDARLGLFSENEGGHGSTVCLNEVNSGVFQDQWAIGRTSSGSNSWLRYTYGTNPDYAANTTFMDFSKTGLMALPQSGNRFSIGTYVSNGIITLGFTNNTILTSTSDASDASRIQIGGGGSASPSRGAYINAMGNEYSGQEGDLSLLAGNSGVSSHGKIGLFTGNSSERLRITSAGSVDVLSGLFTIGVAGTTLGTVGLSGSTSGTVSIKPQAAAGTYNFNLPTAAGTAGQPLLSGGGGSSPQTYGTVGVAAGGTGATDASGARTNLSAAALTQSDEFISGYIQYPDEQRYKLVIKIPHGATITETTTVCESGTCTATFDIDTTALGGTANSVSSVEQSQSQASNNVAAVGNDIGVTISSNSSCIGLSFTIKYTRTLS